jgi:GntR family transcriptional regulator
MFDEIDPRSPVPLYEQIASRVRVAIAAGELQPGTPLPSVRKLSAQLRINPATVVQAYRDLAGDGFVTMEHGRGTFVNDVSPDRKGVEQSEQARRLIRKMLADAARLGIPTPELAAAFAREAGVYVDG